MRAMLALKMSPKFWPYYITDDEIRSEAALAIRGERFQEDSDKWLPCVSQLIKHLNGLL